MSRVIFDMLLQLHNREAEELSSEKLFVGLLRFMHEEISIDRLEQTRLSRSRKLGNEMTVTGSPLGAIILDVRLICFVSKVAHEISTHGGAVVFSGVYANEASSLLEELMSIDHLKWQDFFVATILRVSGEGTLASTLGPNGQLRRMVWCQEWIHGLPSKTGELAQSLKEAEDALAEAIAEENQKARELRLCPHCRQQFSVLATNCGTFVCGRDFHGNGQAGHGCGNTFQLDSAQYYAPDESLLAPLRNAVTTEQARFREHEDAVSLWDNARGMQLPTIAFKIERGSSQSSLLPSSSFLSEVDEEQESSIAPLTRLLLEGTQVASHFALLPDLIEVWTVPPCR